MKYGRALYTQLTTIIAIGLFIWLGFSLFLYSQPLKEFSEELLIRDLLWMDCWALSFFALLIIVWIAPFQWRVKGALMVCAFAAYSFVTGCLIFDGTPYSYNGFWGDQTFRQAMVLKFMTFSWPTDFFYSDLPPFYPPAYFYSLSMIGKLFSIEHIKLAKIGSLLIYLVGPAFLYYVWTRIVSSFQAVLITITTFLFWSYGEAMPFYSPHAFLANIFFVPWWIYFIERVRPAVLWWPRILLGGLTGALIFMTYPYAFFIGGFLMILRSTIFIRWSYLTSWPKGALKTSWLILGAVALFSSPYWLPTLISLFQYGGKAGEQEWYHIGHTGIKFEFLQFTLRGMLFLFSLFMLLRRPSCRVNRGLLLLVGADIAFHLVGTFLGSIGHPLNLQKATEFLIFLAGPAVGLSLAAVIRYGRRRRQSKYAVAILASLLLLVFLNGFNSFAKHRGVKSARTSPHLKTWGTEPEEMAQRAGSTFLTAHQKFPAFYPVYLFIGHNQHYSHPASRFQERFDFLCNLQGVSDPYIFAVALRHNRFSRVDYFMPREKNGFLEIPIGMSNYPIRSYNKVLKFDRSLVTDTSLFSRLTGEHLYRVLEPSGLPDRTFLDAINLSLRDSLLQLLRFRMIRSDLNQDGQDLLQDYVGADLSGSHTLLLDGEVHGFDREIELIACQAATVGDSTCLLLAYRVNRDQSTDYKLFLHLYGQSGDKTFYNYDFWPQERTTSWKKGDIVLCCRIFSTPPENCKFILGFFTGDDRKGAAFNGYLPAGQSASAL